MKEEKIKKMESEYHIPTTHPIGVLVIMSMYSSS
jgi:hypothetical protein